jgi:FkbH-like protein
MPDSRELNLLRRLGRQLLSEWKVTEEPADVFVVGTFNLELLPPLLAEALHRRGLKHRVGLADFGQLAQAFHDPNSSLYAARPSAVLAVVAAEDWLSPLIERPARFDESAQRGFVHERAADLEGCLDAMFARLPTTVCYLATIGPIVAPGAAVFDSHSPHSGLAACRLFWERLREFASRNRRLIIVDWNWHCGETGRQNAVDDRLWYAARMRLSEAGAADLADLSAEHFAAYAGSFRKVAVLDLDNTLWGGVVGEVGWQNVQLGNEGVGLAYQDFQRELLRWYDQGVLLAVCSKNNPADAWEVFDRNAEMILKREHLAAAVVNWEDKAANCRSLAAQLNLSLDALVFFDDNPAERAWLRQVEPRIEVAELPDDPALRPSFLKRRRFFPRLGVTSEDLNRTTMYRAEASRAELRSKSTDLSEFLQSLEQRLTIETLSNASTARAAQLCLRTNQFNFTNRRYTEAELSAAAKDPNAAAVVVRLADRFGDHGLTGFALLRFDEDRGRLDSFLLSCRILGRRVEHALLGRLFDMVLARGHRCLEGRLLRTDKNVPAAQFLDSIGITCDESGRFTLTAEHRPRLDVPEIQLVPQSPGET